MCQILASQIASVVESGNLGQLLWRDLLQHDTDNLISEKFCLHQIHACDAAGICISESVKMHI